MAIFASQVLALARMEWRVTWRSLGFSLVLLLTALPFTAVILTAHRIPYWADDGGLANLSFDVPFVALLAAFLIVPAYRREQTARTAELLWVRPIDGAAYLVGKVLGAALVMAAVLAEMTILVALYQLTGGGTIGLPLLVGTLFVAVPALLLAAVLYVACGALLPHPLLGYLIALIVCSLFGFFLSQSMIFLWNPWAQGLSYKPVLGFGPDVPLLLSNRLFYSGLTLGLLGGTLAFFARRERRALVSRWYWRRTLTVLVCGAAISGLALPPFRAAVASVTPTGPVVAPQAVALVVTDYRLDLRMDPATGVTRGQARFAIRNNGSAPIATLPLYLNDGLHISAATVDGRPVVVRSASLFGSLTLSPTLAPGAGTTVWVAYAGRYKLLNNQFAAPKNGLLGHASYLGSMHQGYIGNGLAVLFRDGDWYPLPWTQGTTTRSPAPLGWRTLTVRVPASATVLASTSAIRRWGNMQLATWGLTGRLPAAVLAVVPLSYAHVHVPGGTVYAPREGAATARARYGPYVTALRDLTAFFNQAVRPIAVMAVPLTTNGAVGNSLALVPLGSLDQPAGEAVIAHRASPAPYRAALSDLADAWWADRLPIRDRPTIYGASLDLPMGYVDVVNANWPWWQDPASGLASYTGAAVAERHFGPGLYTREMNLRRAIDTIARRDPTKWALMQTDQRPQPPALRAALQALGLQQRLQPGEATLVFDRLRRVIGADRLRHVLIRLAAAGTTPDDMDSVACALSHATGQPVATWTDHYVFGNAPLALPGGCR